MRLLSKKKKKRKEKEKTAFLSTRGSTRITEPERADRRGALGFLVPSRRVHAEKWCPRPLMPMAGGG